MNPLVTCIVPVFNGERFLRESLDSILAQTYSPIEVIVVDDGSTDGTAAVAENFAPSVRCVRQANAGAPRARNCGLREARGEFITFLDADDLWHPEKTERQAARFAARPELDFCATQVQNFWMPEVSAEGEQFRDHRRGRAVPGYVTDSLMVRRRTFERVGGFSETLRHGDATDWVLRARAGGAVEELLGDVLVQRRMHQGNISRSCGEQSRSEFLDIIKKSLDLRRAGDRGNKGS